MAITSSAKRIVRAAGSGLDQLIILGVTGSVACFPELIMSALHRTKGKMLWVWDIRVVGLLPCIHPLQPCLAWVFSTSAGHVESVLFSLEVKNK